MVTLNVDGQDVPVMSFKEGLRDQDLDSGVNLAGYMERNILAHSRRTIDIVLPPCTKEQLHEYMKLFHKTHLAVKVWCIFEGKETTIDMMHGDLIGDMYWQLEYGSLYKATTIQLVEY